MANNQPTDLMPQILALFTPANALQSNTGSKKKKRELPAKFNRKNNEHCNYCGEGGSLLCCDSCPAVFHLICCEPPLEEDEVPEGEWKCRRCIALENINVIKKDDSDLCDKMFFKNNNTSSSSVPPKPPPLVTNSEAKNEGDAKESDNDKAIAQGAGENNIELVAEGDVGVSDIEEIDAGHSDIEEVNVVESDIEELMNIEQSDENETMDSDESEEENEWGRPYSKTSDVSSQEEDEDESQELREEELEKDIRKRIDSTFGKLSLQSLMTPQTLFDLPKNLLPDSPFINPSKEIIVDEDHDNITDLIESNYKITVATRTNKRKSKRKQSNNTITKLVTNGTASRGRVTTPFFNDMGPDRIFNRCFFCDKTSGKAPMIKCDFCHTPFHPDCLDPPMTALPTSSQPWMCPIHPEHQLQHRVLKNPESLSERIKLSESFTSEATLDPDSIISKFIHNINTQFPPRAYRPPAGNIVLPTTTVPAAIKEAYRKRPPLVPFKNDTSSCDNNSTELETKPIRNLQLEPATREERLEWLSCLTAMHVNAAKEQNNKNCDSQRKRNIHTYPEPENPFSMLKISTNDESFSNMSGSDETLSVCSENLDLSRDSDNGTNEKRRNGENIFDVLNQLDKGLIRLLALQRLQELQFDPTRIQWRKNNLPHLAELTLKKVEHHFGADVRSRAFVCPVVSHSWMLPDPSDMKPMVYRSFTFGTDTKNNVVLGEYGRCNYISSKHAVIFYDELSRRYEILNYSEFGTIVDGVFLSTDISDKPAHSRKRYKSIEDATITGINDILWNNRKEQINQKTRRFLRKEFVIENGSHPIKRAINDVHEIDMLNKGERAKSLDKMKKLQVTKKLPKFQGQMGNKKVQKKPKKRKQPPPSASTPRKGDESDDSRESLVEISERVLKRNRSVSGSDSGSGSDVENVENGIDELLNDLDENDSDEILRRWKLHEQRPPPAKMNGHATKKWVPCQCDNVGHKSNTGESGWEGSVTLHHGSTIQIGCFQFVFGISAFGKVDPSEKQKKQEQQQQASCSSVQQRPFSVFAK